MAKTLDELAAAFPTLVQDVRGRGLMCAFSMPTAAQRDTLVARLWDAVAEFDVGFCLDTCHAWAGGEDLIGLVERVRQITGRIDLVHLNNSRDEFDSGRDRHANLASGHIDPEVLVVSVGSMAGTATTVAEKLAAEGHSTLVVDPRWVLPVPAALVELAARSGRVAVIEDNNVSGGVGAEVARVLDEAEVTAPVHRFGLPKEFLAHASRAQVLESVGLTPEPIVERLRAHL